MYNDRLYKKSCALCKSYWYLNKSKIKWGYAKYCTTDLWMEVPNMKQTNAPPMLMRKLAKFAVSALCAVLFICANTNSCCMVHQPQAPAELERFNKLRWSGHCHLGSRSGWNRRGLFPKKTKNCFPMRYTASCSAFFQYLLLRCWALCSGCCGKACWWLRPSCWFGNSVVGIIWIPQNFVLPFQLHCLR